MQTKKKSWKTTVLGWIAGAGLLVSQTPLNATTVGKWTAVAAAIAIALQGTAAQDADALKDSAKKDKPVSGDPPPTRQDLIDQ